MWNPFKTELPTASGTTYAPQASATPPSGDIWVAPDKVTLDHADYPDSLTPPMRGFVSDTTQDGNPGYAGETGRQILFEPGQRDTHSFLNPAPGSQDLIVPRDTGGIPGTDYQNITQGPVTGNAMDAYQNIRQGTQAVPPGYGGPVVGGPDQGEALAAAYFQAQFDQFSNAASDQAMVSAV